MPDTASIAEREALHSHLCRTLAPGMWQGYYDLPPVGQESARATMAACATALLDDDALIVQFKESAATSEGPTS